MKRLLLSALLSAPLALMAAQPAALSAQQIEQAKRETARAGGELGSKTFQVDAQGNVLKDAQGNPVLQSSGLGGMQDGLRLFQTTTGTKGVSPQSSPSAGGGVASIAVEQSFELQCSSKLPPGLQFSAAGFTLRPQSCVLGSNGQVLTAQFKVCDNSQKAGVCAQSADFTGSLSLNNGSFVSYQGFEAGLGCNSAAQCRVTLKGSQQVGAAASQLEQKAAEKAAQSNVVSEWRDMTSNPTYSQKMAEVGQPLAQCAELNADGAATGRYVTCDGRSTVALDNNTSSDGSCGSAAQCLQESVSQRTTTRSCVRTFPMTERSFKREYNRLETCVLRDYLADKKGVDKFGTDSTSCVGPNGSSRLGGMTKVGDTPWTCVQMGVLNDPEPTQSFYDKDGKLMVAPYPDPLPVVYDKDGKVIDKPYQDPVEECVAKEQTQWWVGLNDYQTLSQTESPSPVGGQCDENPLSASHLVQCEGTWFGRTEPEAACQGTYQLSDTETVSWGRSFQDENGWGCGFCTKPRVRQTCQAVPRPTQPQTEAGADDADSCESLELTGCSMTSASALTFSGGDSGIPTSQRETYTCVKEERQCTRWSAGANDSSCIKTDMAQGLDKVRDSSLNDQGSFNNAMVAASLLDGVAKGSEGKSDQQIPLIFNGENNQCSYPTGAVGSLVTKNCCRQDLFRPKKGILFQQGCGMEETKLAAARRSRYAVYVGEYCSKKLPWPFKTCIRRTQSYCVFQGILPRLVHEQGREQLAQMVGSSGAADVQKGPLNFPYYDSGDGSWSSAVTLNGVSVRAWQWPKHCANLADAAEARMMESDANGCPATVTTWFAACDKQGGCGALTDSPEFGAMDWTLKAVDGLKNQTSAVSKYSVVTGACSPSTGNCTYEAAAWPIGVGGRAVVTKDLTWPLFSSEGIAPSGDASAQDYVFNNVGDLMFRMYPAAGAAGGALPANVRLGFSRDGGQTWKDAQLPTQSLSAAEATLPGSDIRVTGSCTVEANTCNYRITGTVTVQAKPWGSPQSPNCSGFTAGQLAALDFSKMDLSEWLETVMDKVADKTDPTALAASANQRFQQFNSLYQSGQVSAGAPVSANFARVTPPEGFGPFNVRLVTAGFWPEYSDIEANNTERVTRVEVDWGDCSPREQLAPAPADQGKGFGGTHAYKVPDADAHACLKTGPADKLERNINHKIKLYVTTLKGSSTASYTRELSVENAWAVFPGADNNNDFIEERKTVAPYGSSTSGAPASVTGTKP